MQRYESYKPSAIPWIDALPQHWGEEKGKWLHRFRKELNNREQCDNVLSLTLRGVVNNDPDDPEGLVPKDYGTYQIFEKDDLVFKLIDLENFRTSRVGLVHERGIMSSAYQRVQPGKEHNPRYFYYYYFTLYQQGIYNKLGAGVRSTLGATDLLEIGVPVPSKDEQDRIVAFLDQKTAEIDAAIAKKERLIELLNEQRSIQVNRAVTMGMNQSVSLKKSESEWIDSIPEHWEIVPLKYISTVQSGVTLGKNHASSKTTKSFSYLRVANVQDGYIDLSTVTEIVLPVREAKNYLLRTGDILVTEGGDIDKLGRGNCWDGQIEECLHQNHVFAVRILKRVRPEFVALITGVSYARRFFTTTANKTTNLASTNKTKLGNLPVIVPPLLEQDAILDFCNRVKAQYEALINSVSREISVLKEMKSSLVAEAVTGKIKV
jgi:type I restriction enzyme S subunit